MPPCSVHALTYIGTKLMDDLLAEFSDLFAEPHGLPLVWEILHCIHLKKGTHAIAVRPYCYVQLQKDELEHQCVDMLQQGTIYRSSSAFSSPVLLVKKRDGSWRFCVDYRTLNDKTIKDKFPIPVIDELLDELCGAKFFTKLDLHSGYHPMRHSADVDKTAFRTH